MRTSMGPSCGGVTCNFAPFILLSTIHDTRSARPRPNSGVSPPAPTFNVGVGLTSAAVVAVAVICAAPAMLFPDASDSKESSEPLSECLSAVPAPAPVRTAGALMGAAGAAAATARASAARASAGTGAPFSPPESAATPPVAGVAKSSVVEEGESAAPAYPASLAATAPETAAASAAA